MFCSIFGSGQLLFRNWNRLLLCETELFWLGQILSWIDRGNSFWHPLRPLSLKDIGQELGLHTSTVSRAIQDKYLSCSWGVFPLRQFLSRYIPSEQPQELDQSGQDFVLRMIQKLVDTEDPAMPLSDQQIFDKLQEKNIFISRRSVSNYREKLSIPSSYVRKRNSTI